MTKKMTLKDMMAQVEAQAQAMAELQAKLDAVTAQATEAQAKAQAEAEKAKAAEAILAEVAGSSNNVMAFDKDIRPVFDFRNYAIPGGDFAVEKVNSRNDNITSSVNVPLDSLFSYEIGQREVDPDEYVRTKPGIYVFNNGEAKIRTYYKPATVARLEYPLTAPVRQFPEAGLKYEDADIPKTEGYLKMRALTDKETGELVWQMFRAQHYQKPQYVFQRATAKYNVSKLPKVGAPKTRPAGASTAGNKRAINRAPFDPEAVLNDLAAAGLAGAYRRRREFKATYENVSWNITANARGGYTHYVGTRPVQTYATAEEVKWAMVR